VIDGRQGRGGRRPTAASPPCRRDVFSDGTGDGVHDAAELREEAVASSIGDATAMLLDRRIPDLAPTILQLGERAFLIGTHQPAASSHTGHKN
jgi:hypothetical protein